MELLMLKKSINLVILLCLTLPAVVNASGTFISFPPKPKPATSVDCDLPENADNEACK